MRKQDEWPQPLEWFLSELDRRVTDADAKRIVIDILARMAGQRLYLASSVLVKAQRPRLALELMRAGFTATQARTELARRLGVSRRTAERIVAQALNERGRDSGDA